MTDSPAVDAYALRILATLQELGIASETVAARQLVLHREPLSLVLAHTGDSGREFLLTPEAAAAWLAMQRQALCDGVPLALVSAFRSVERQREIIQAKLDDGMSVQTILQSVAPPGYSEHHTGRAIDIATSEADALEEVFETTTAFAWLTAHAKHFGFQLSYPRNNPCGFLYEPWHWCFRP